MMENLVQIEHLVKNYPGFSLDLDELHIKPGTICGLAGVNGSGKTTAFRLILGLIQADGGKISVLDQDAWNLSPEFKSKIGVVFSDSGFQPFFTPEDIKKILAGFYDTFDPALFDRLCEKTGLPQEKALKTFSSGMLARFRIVAAISHQPQLLILDEPTAGLDVLARQDIHALLQDYMDQPGRAVLISSHIASDLEQLCDDLYMIKDGRIYFHETVDALQNEYGILHLSEQQMESLDKQAVLAVVKSAGGYDVLVSDRRFYEENYPGIVTERGNIDDLIVILEKEKKV